MCPPVLPPGQLGEARAAFGAAGPGEGNVDCVRPCCLQGSWAWSLLPSGRLGRGNINNHNNSNNDNNSNQFCKGDSSRSPYCT